MLGKPLDVIDYGTVNTNNDVLDDSFLFLPPLSIKPSVQVPVHKSFALDIDFVAITGKFSQEKLSFIRKIFSSVNGFGGASTSSKFGGVIHVTFTLEKAMMAAGKLANNHDIVVNTNLKHLVNNCTNRDIVIKEIPVGTLIEVVHAALVGLWQKAIVTLGDSDQADLLVSKWSILIRKDAVWVARADVDKQTWDSRNEFKTLLYTFSVGTNAHDLWDFIGSVGGKTCVIKHNSVNYTWVYCTTVCFESKSNLNQALANTLVIKDVSLHWSCLFAALCSSCNSLGYTSRNCKSADNWFRLAKIYERKSASVFHLLAFGGKTWASVLGFIRNGKFLPPVVNDLKKHLVSIKSSLVSLIEQIGKLAKRLKSFMPAVSQSSPGCQLLVTSPSQNQEEDMVMGVDSSDATSDKTATISGCEIEKYVERSLCFSHEPISMLGWFGFGKWCFFSTFFSMSSLVWKIAMCNVRGLNNPAKQDNVIHWHKDMNNLVSIFMKSKLKGKVCPWLTDKFDGIRVFTSGLNSGFMGASVLIVASKINSLIAKAINKSSFVILGGDFNENGSQKCASFKKCLELGLVNSLIGSPAIKMLTWANSRGVMKTIDYVFVSPNLVNFLVYHGVLDVNEYFDTDHQAVSVSISLSGLLDTHLFSLCKQANKDYWKFDVKNTSEAKWLEFKDATAANTTMFLGAFGNAVKFSDLGAMWDVIYKIMVLSAGGVFKRRWFKDFDTVCNKVSSRFHKLELLVFKLVKTSCLSSSVNFALLLGIWDNLDSAGASTVRFMFSSGAKFDDIHSALAKARRSYCSSKLLKSKHAEESHIRQAITNRIESFELDKDYTIRSVLECSFYKVVLDHLVVDNELVLEPNLVKSKINTIMEGWTRKCVVVDNIFDTWFCQYKLLNYIFDDAFSEIMSEIDFNELHHVITSLPNEKAAGLLSISNEL
ncbi:hypothetical protein G9A89_021539 [Geosiphon pyriformis]|nr:hypothetical protein G9A89_021539 [Geosiphon pyriformis]